MDRNRGAILPVHRLTTLFVIALLLTCPYACSGGMGCCAPSGEDAPQACCEHCAQSTTGEKTSQPANDEPCTSCCLCKGAVLSEAAPLAGSAGTFLLELPTVEGDSPALPVEIVREYDPVSHWPGDSLRIAIASLTC